MTEIERLQSELAEARERCGWTEDGHADYVDQLESANGFLRDRAEKAESELAAANERAEKLTAALRVLVDSTPWEHVEDWYPAMNPDERHALEIVREALRSTPAVRADPSIPKDEIHFINRDGTVAGKIVGLATSAQEPKPHPIAAGHAFARQEWGNRCADCGLHRSAHQPSVHRHYFHRHLTGDPDGSLPQCDCGAVQPPEEGR